MYIILSVYTITKGSKSREDPGFMSQLKSDSFCCASYTCPPELVICPFQEYDLDCVSTPFLLMNSELFEYSWVPLNSVLLSDSILNSDTIYFH